MPQREVIVFKSKTNKNITHSKYTFRGIVRYTIMFTIASLIAFLLFSITDLKHIKSDFDTFAKINASKVIGISIVATIGVMAIKMNQISFNGAILNTIMVLIAFGYAAFVTVELMDYKVKHLIDLNELYHYAWPAALYLTVWYLISAYTERRTRPQLAGYLIWRSIGSVFAQGATWMGYLFIYKFTSIVKEDHISFDREDPYHLFIVAAAVILVLLEMAQVVVRFIKYKKATNKEDIIKSMSLGLVFMLVVPLATWYVYNYIMMPETLEEYLFGGANILIMIFAIISTTLKKGKVSSPVVTTTIYSLCIVLVWVNKFAFDSFEEVNTNTTWETSASLISMVIIISCMVFKNNPATMMQSGALILFATLMSGFILGDSVLNAFPQQRDEIDIQIKLRLGMSWDEALNTVLLTSSVGLVFAATTEWYKVQSKINHNLAVKLRKGGKHA